MTDMFMFLDAAPDFPGALCAQTDPDMFFPIGENGKHYANLDAARAICHRCEHIADCLTWALDQYPTDGIIAGTTLRERRALRQKGKAT